MRAAWPEAKARPDARIPDTRPTRSLEEYGGTSCYDCYDLMLPLMGAINI